MVPNDPAMEIVADWRRTIEIGQEAGERPSIYVGESKSLVDGIGALMACHSLASSRVDLTSPRILVGGASPLWSAFLLHGITTAASTAGTPSPAMAAVFAGADTATTIASETIEEFGPSTRSSGVASDIPAGLASWLAPTTVGSLRPWSSLSLALMEQRTVETSNRPATDWSAYAALILALCILALAFLL